jgi:hypothetical protein
MLIVFLAPLRTQRVGLRVDRHPFLNCQKLFCDRPLGCNIIEKVSSSSWIANWQITGLYNVHANTKMDKTISTQIQAECEKI